MFLIHVFDATDSNLSEDTKDFLEQMFGNQKFRVQKYLAALTLEWWAEKEE